MADPVLTARDVGARFDTSAGRVQAPRVVDFDLYPGETPAIAAVRQSAALYADEPTTARVVTVQALILAFLKSPRDVRGMAMLFLSHDLGDVANIVDRIAAMREGEVVELKAAGALFAVRDYPCTRALLASWPGSSPQPDRRAALRRTTNAQSLSELMVDARGLSFSHLHPHARGIFGSQRPDFLLAEASLRVRANNANGSVSRGRWPRGRSS